jgi:hypothetical protein
MGKNKEVSGILSKDHNIWIVTVSKPNGFVLPYSVSFQTIKQL